MADVILTSIINLVSALCSCSANNRSCYILDLQENKEVLNDAMVELKATRDGVKIKVDEKENNPDQKRTPEVEIWLQGVQTIDNNVDQVSQTADQEIEGRCFGPNCPINCWSAHKIGKLVIKELGIVKEHKSKGDLFLNNDKEVAYKIPLRSVQEEPMNTTVGMGSMFDKVWRLLVEDKVRIMGLYGYGGVGKTTLLNQINNTFLKPTTTTTSSSSNSTHGFDVVILVVVSKTLNINKIQMEIGKRLGLSSTEADKTSIFNALTKKSFVLLLDDIWDRVDLQSIGVPPPSENNKSKVVFTTRSEVVCGLMEANEIFKVECLPWNEAWSLFEGKVGERALKSFPRARELAEVVARECGGLPLALITIGRAMAAKKTPHEWKDAITTLQKYASKFPGMDKEVLPILKLSYDNLGDDDMIKSCFLYCALFPEDYSIDNAKLIDYWIGEGLISLNEFDNIDEARNKGYGVIGDLKGASLLESGRDEETQVKMHDTIRDLALWIAHDCGNKRDKMCIIDTSDLTPERLSSWYNNAEIIYLITPPLNARYGATEEVRSPLKSPSLITLILHPFCDLSVLPQNFFEFTPLLRVLDLSQSALKTFPISITELVELRYLSLSWTFIKELPEELRKLVKLRVLDLSYMGNLMTIPPGVIGSLLELRVLNLFKSFQVDWDFDEVYKLKHLNDLGININTEHNTLQKLLSSSNKNLQMCTRHLNLVIPSLSSIITIEHQHHLGSSCFQNLIEIEISHCSALKDLTWVGYVPNLKTLKVSYCKELEIIVVDDDLGGSKGGGNELIFKSLETLHLNSLPKLKSICSHALAFPCLKYLKVSECPQLKKLPFHSGSNVNNTLRDIQGGPRWWSELQWEEEDHNNNNNNELLKSKFLPYFVEESYRD